MIREQALSILRQLAESYRGTLQEHQDLQQALKVLEDEKPEEEKK